MIKTLSITTKLLIFNATAALAHHSAANIVDEEILKI